MIGPDKPDELGGETAAPDGLQSDPECLDGKGNDDDDDDKRSALHQCNQKQD